MGVLNNKPRVVKASLEGLGTGGSIWDLHVELQRQMH